MARYLPAFACATVALLCRAQAPTQAPNLAAILSFETDHPGGSPGGWGSNPPGSVHADDHIVHGGRWSARIERPEDSSGGLSGITKSIPMDFTGKSLEMRGFLRTEEVTGFVGMWAREDGESAPLAFDNMQSRQLKGTNDWREYSITIPVNPEARQLVFGVFVTGTGRVWADDLQLLVDGKPVWEAPKREVPKTVLDSDHEFDAGSGIALNELTRVQIENLTTLGKVWGFLKYHHARVTAGQRHWDYDLFRVMPLILDAPDHAAANAALVKWIAGLEAPPPCNPCAKLETGDIHLHPALEWLDDQPLLGADLSRTLRAIHTSRPANGKQFYLSLLPGVGNPEFHHELAYPRMKPGDAGLQILAAYRFWNIIEYWSPYRDVLGEKWDEVLRQTLPKIALAKTPEDYQRELMALIARAHDTHANLWSSLAARPPVGACRLAVNVRFVENRAVVTGYSGAEAGKATGLKPGDVITGLDGVPVSQLVENWTPYYAASNQPTRLRDMARAMTRGACGETKVTIRRESEELSLTAKRVPPKDLDLSASNTHDLPGETFRRLSDDVAYLKLSSIKIADVRRYIDAALGTKGLIIDIRNYPSQFVVFALGQSLVDRPAPFVHFTQGDLSNPGAFHWGQQPIALVPQTPHYAGKVVILVDEVSQSQAEYTTMAFRTAPGAKVVGSTTAGADGNVSQIPLPGGLNSMISGIGVFYPDNKPTQRIGILADVEAHPTIAGIRDGRDEVLEEAVRQILGKETPAEQIRKMLQQ
jgi:C-terminal processing protease CtpA/Prc